MKDGFLEVKFFQVKPDKLTEFEALIADAAEAQKQQTGCIDINVKYFSYWEFDNKENYGKAVDWFFKSYGKEIQKLLIMPFDINCGNSIY